MSYYDYKVGQESGGVIKSVLCYTPQFKVGDLPPDGYVAWHEWARVQYNGGLRQYHCTTTKKWEFPQKHKSHAKGVEHREVP